MKSDYKRLLCIGPGGVKCACCFPAPGTKARRLAFKSLRKKEERQLQKLLKDEMKPEPELALN